ncbi:MAG: glycerol-3-phosphate 1-O-acyltransferase PlsY [Spirosomataceae bacterium]
MPLILPFVLLGYVLGSIPTAVWYGRVFHGVDIRNHGSGNAGATNSLRILGKKAGIVVLVFDILKGVIPVLIARTLEASIEVQLTTAFFTIIGHLLPVFAHFRGGKGIATSLGVIAAVYPFGAMASLFTFLVLVYVTRYVSLGSLIGAAFFSVMVGVLQPVHTQELLIFGLSVLLLLVFTHRQNIVRLWNGTENKFGEKKAE